MEEILNYIPFNSYLDIFNAVKNGKATIKLMRSDCSQIASLKHPYFSVLGMYIGFITTLILLIFLSIKLQNFWLLLLIPINFILSTIINYIPILNKIAWIPLIIDMFFVRLPIGIIISSIDIILISFFYNVWWNRLYKYAIIELELNEEAFLWSWNRNGLSIEDSFGNIYYKFKMQENVENKNTLKNETNLQSIMNNPEKINSIIIGKETVSLELFINKQNPYTGKIIQNYDDIIEYLKMYQLDYNNMNPLEILNNKN